MIAAWQRRVAQPFGVPLGQAQLPLDNALYPVATGNPTAIELLGAVVAFQAGMDGHAEQTTPTASPREQAVLVGSIDA